MKRRGRVIEMRENGEREEYNIYIGDRVDIEGRRNRKDGERM